MLLQGAIFDMDGTLLDSMAIWDTVSADYLLSRGIEPRPGLKAVFKTLSLWQAAEYYRSSYGLEDDTQSIMDGINAMVERFYAEKAAPKRGVPALLAELRRRGVPMCVATATDRYLVESTLKRCGLLEYFSAIFTCTEVGRGKDSPDIYELALRALGCPKSGAAVFEDALYAAKTARAAGFCVVGVSDPYEPRRAELSGLSDFFVTDFEAGALRGFLFDEGEQAACLQSPGTAASAAGR